MYLLEKLKLAIVRRDSCVNVCGARSVIPCGANRSFVKRVSGIVRGKTEVWHIERSGMNDAVVSGKSGVIAKEKRAVVT